MNQVLCRAVAVILSSLFLASAATAAPASKRKVRSVAAASPLQIAFGAAHHDYTAQLLDKFADRTVSDAIVGQPFKIIVPLHSGDELFATPGDAYYTYKDGQLLLNFSADSILSMVDYTLSRPQPRGAIVAGFRRYRKSYVGSNAYGASVRVDVFDQNEDGLVFASAPVGEESPYTSKFSTIAGLDPPSLPRNSYWLRFDLSGSAAKRLALDTVLVVEGAIRRFDDGKLDKCESNYVEPKIDTGYEQYGSKCWFNADVSRIAFVRKSTGEVLKEWPSR
jgi:hypothetical protein